MKKRNNLHDIEKRRLEFHEVLCKILGSRNVYFQPPEDLLICYPAIIYSRASIESERADNIRYLNFDKFSVTLVGDELDSSIIDALLELPFSECDRTFVASNLNHTVFTIYYQGGKKYA